MTKTPGTMGARGHLAFLRELVDIQLDIEAGPVTISHMGTGSWSLSDHVF